MLGGGGGIAKLGRFIRREESRSPTIWVKSRKGREFEVKGKSVIVAKARGKVLVTLSNCARELNC